MLKSGPRTSSAIVAIAIICSALIRHVGAVHQPERQVSSRAMQEPEFAVNFRAVEANPACVLATPFCNRKEATMHIKAFSKTLLLGLIAVVAISAQTRRPMKLDDLARFRNVGDPQVSPEGKSIAYTVSTTDVKEDKGSTHIWMIGCDGTSDRQITFSNDGEGGPRWSPDGKYLSFTSGRSSGKQGVRGSQIWLLDRSG